MKRGQNGFTIVEALLVLILLAILGFTGYYVYHTKNNTNSTYNSATNTANNTPPATSSNKLVFKEIGVQIVVPADLNGLAYNATTSDGVQYLGLYTPKFEAALHKCDPTTAASNNSPFMTISKMTGTYDENSYPGAGNLKQFSGFWVSGASPNGIVCADSATQQDKDDFQFQFNNSIAAIRDAFKNASLVK